MINKISFVYLIEMKFNGELLKLRKFHFEGNIPYFELTIKFQEISEYRDAFSHCKINLDCNGNIRLNYIGALKYADPKHRRAKEILNHLEELSA